ncbi:MAG: NAD(P)H-hydrate epimerase [Pirellulaceae bacterium]|nr:NAD(P)H-hydrate epimerase [Pirellulaceae bacterium]
MATTQTLPLTRAQSRDIDRVAIQEFGFSSLVLMENAASGAARFLQSRYLADGGILIVCGAGNNGGDGLVMARHLYNAGLPVAVLLMAAGGGRLCYECQANWQIVKKTRLSHRTLSPNTSPIAFSHQWDEAVESAVSEVGPITWVVDAVLGTGANGPLRHPVDMLVRKMQTIPAAQRMALDLPTGWDCDRGPSGADVFRATITYTFVAPKISFQHPSACEYLGEIIVGEIGIPPEVLAKCMA